MKMAMIDNEMVAYSGGRKMVFIKMPDTLWNREYSDKVRLRQFRRAVREGIKPSRWYYDNPADKGSAYRRRYIAILEIAADVIENSPCDGLVGFAKNFVADARGQLPVTVAAWIKGMPRSRKRTLLASIPPAPNRVSDAQLYGYGVQQ